jgi:pSer/pThr/pTyr-binding forkhead associated (FHA) protein
VDVNVPDQAPCRVPLPHVELIVGRNPQRCNVALEDAKVSRVHLRVAQELDRVTVTDLYSANGTQLEDGMLVPGLPAVWLADQTVMLGLTRLTLRYDQLTVRW